MMKTNKRRISISDFSFELVGHGHYKVIYTSPATGKQWNRIIDDMMIIDATKGEGEDAKRKDLEELKRQVKSNY